MPHPAPPHRNRAFHWIAKVAAASVVGLACVGSLVSTRPAAAAPTVKAVVTTYADIAEAAYTDALTTARRLQTAVDQLIATPSAATLANARAAWTAARVPYMQTEAFRFGNKIVDDWEGKVNAWPLDEGLIDYVGGSYGTASDSNRLYTANIIANRKIMVAGQQVDATVITKDLLRALHEAEKIEANVATGYHAIEFLLWGQDLNGTGPGAGKRPHTDYDTKACTNANCDRRAQYLKAATDLLVDDLAWMAAQWAPGAAARQALAGSDLDALTAIFTGLGSLSYGEMAGERMKLGLLLNDPEEEHDCFSDTTHLSHYYDVVGIVNVYLGRYTRIDGSVLQGPSLSDLVKAKAPDIDARVRTALDATMARMTAIRTRAETVEAYDQMLAEGNAEGNAVLDAAVGALVAQTKEFERAIAALDIKAVKIEGSDSLDDPTKALSGKK